MFAIQTYLTKSRNRLTQTQKQVGKQITKIQIVTCFTTRYLICLISRYPHLKYSQLKEKERTADSDDSKEIISYVPDKWLDKTY